MTRNHRATTRLVRLVIGAVAGAALAGCSSAEDEPTDASGSAAVTPSDTPTVEPSEESGATAPAPVETTPTGTPAPADEPPSSAAPEGCDPAAYTATASVDVRRSATQLLGFRVTTLAPGTGVSGAREVDLFEALFSGIVDQDGGEVTGPLRETVVERLGDGVVRDGVDRLRVPVRIRNRSDQDREYVVYASAVRSEGGWEATWCPEGAAGPTRTTGTFAAWQRLDGGVVECGTEPSTVSRVARDALLNGCG